MRIFPLGENALTVDFGNVISEEINNRVLQIAHFFEENPFAGLEEVCPAYSSVTLFYDIVTVRKNFPTFETAFDAVKSFVEQAFLCEKQLKLSSGRLFEIPVSFDKAPDLEFVASHNHLTSEQVIEIFLSRTYRVFMIGFLPGFAYMGTLDERIATPRKQTPRVSVEKGSVGIAGKQTGIYPINSPGGWQIIGKTDVELFDITNETSPTLLKAGDLVKFYRL